MNKYAPAKKARSKISLARAPEKKKSLKAKYPDTVKINEDTMFEKIKLDYINSRGLNVEYYENKLFGDEYLSYKKMFTKEGTQEPENPYTKVQRTIDIAKDRINEKKLKKRSFAPSKEKGIMKKASVEVPKKQVRFIEEKSKSPSPAPQKKEKPKASVEEEPEAYNINDLPSSGSGELESGEDDDYYVNSADSSSEEKVAPIDPALITTYKFTAIEQEEAEKSSSEDERALQKEYKDMKEMAQKSFIPNTIKQKNPKVPRAKEAFRIVKKSKNAVPFLDETKRKKQNNEDNELAMIRGKVAHFQDYLKGLKGRMVDLLGKTPEEIEDDKTKLLVQNYENQQKHMVSKNKNGYRS